MSMYIYIYSSLNIRVDIDIFRIKYNAYNIIMSIVRYILLYMEIKDIYFASVNIRSHVLLLLLVVVNPRCACAQRGLL